MSYAHRPWVATKKMRSSFPSIAGEGEKSYGSCRMKTGMACRCAALWLAGSAALPALAFPNNATAIADRSHEQAVTLNETGLAKAGHGDNAGAVADYDAALRINPDYATAYGNRAVSKLVLGDVAGAQMDCDEAIRLDPSQPNAYETRAQCRQRRGDLPGALGDLNTAIAQHPRYPDHFYVTRGHVRFQAGDADGALSDYSEAIRLAPRNALAFLGRSAVKEARNDLEGAYADAETAIYCDPGLAEAYGHRGMLRAKRKDLAGAKDDFDQAVALGTRTAGIYFQRGLLRGWTGDYAGARADYDQAEQLHPNIPRLPLNRAVADQALGRWDDAAADFAQEMAQTARQGAEAGRLPLCLWLAKRRAHPRDPAPDLGVDLSPAGTGPADWNTTLGRFLLGKLDEAALLAAAASPDPRTDAYQHCEAWYYAGMRRLQAADAEGAAACFRKAIVTGQETRLEYSLAQAMLAAPR